MEKTEKSYKLKRNNQIILRLTDEENEQLRLEAFKAKKSMNQLIIEKIFNKSEENY